MNKVTLVSIVISKIEFLKKFISLPRVQVLLDPVIRRGDKMGSKYYQLVTPCLSRGLGKLEHGILFPFIRKIFVLVVLSLIIISCDNSKSFTYNRDYEGKKSRSFSHLNKNDQKISWDSLIKPSERSSIGSNDNKKYVFESSEEIYDFEDSNDINFEKEYVGYYKIGNPYKIMGTTYYPQEYDNYEEVGEASWYGSKFHGKKTANGEIYNMGDLTAAHRTLPLPSIVRVTNLDNSKSLIVRVNDRGPFAKDRIIDLSMEAAEILDFKSKGLANVKVELLKEDTKNLLAKLGLKY